MARQPLWSIAVWLALLDNQHTARRYLATTASELNWALQLIGPHHPGSECANRPSPIKKIFQPARFSTPMCCQFNRAAHLANYSET